MGRKCCEAWKNKDALKDMYVNKRMSSTEIAEKLGCSPRTIRRWLDRHGIEIRPKNVAISLAKGPLSLSLDGQGYEQFKTRENTETVRIRHHRLLAVAEFGFDAVRENIVHHKNSLKWDNRPENLVLLSRSDHSTLHGQQRSREQSSRARDQERNNRGEFL